jgi:hypothetical protein
MMTARPAMMLAKAVRPIRTPRTCPGRNAPIYCIRGGMNLISIYIGVVIIIVELTISLAGWLLGWREIGGCWGNIYVCRDWGEGWRRGFSRDGCSRRYWICRAFDLLLNGRCLVGLWLSN